MTSREHQAGAAVLAPVPPNHRFDEAALARYLVVLILLAALAGCASNGARIDANARAAGLARQELTVEGRRVLLYRKSSQRGAPLIVFLEGDGRPWRGGVEPNDDPTTRQPIALELLKRTQLGGVYLTRPCYHGLQDVRCTPQQWTSARYGEDIVGIMSRAVREAMYGANAAEVVLVGYSGGGVLAVLIAERLESVRGVITLAANLDTDAWTAHHRYLPLSDSLNPSQSAQEHRWPELHLQGARDRVVPPATTARYFERFPGAQRRVIADYDHVCCWVDAWPALAIEMLEEAD